MYNILKFVKPAIKKKNFITFISTLIFSILLFCVGIFFTYSILIPVSLEFLISFAGDENIFLSINLILSLMLWVMFSIGLLFQMPIIAFFLSRVGILNHRFLSRNRRYAILFSFIFSAFITPPDVVSQIILGLPTILLYEICIIIVKKTGSKK